MKAAPRVLALDLTRLAPESPLWMRPLAWSSSCRGLHELGRLSGSALALAWIFEHSARSGAARTPLVLAVGECVRAGMPTADRASVASRAPLTGLYADGQVGSDLGRRLARLTDALSLSGEAAGSGAVLVLDAGNDRGADEQGAVRVELRNFPELAGASPAHVHEFLQSRLGPCAVLSIGAAGEHRLPFASLAAGADPPHFVGRGGLGAVMGGMRLKALAVRCAPVSAAAMPPGLAQALLSSPRLRTRGSEGTHELLSALAARGALLGRNYTREIDRADARDLSAEASSLARGRHGCKGCPTPCGLVFETSNTRQAAHFSATYALGANLGVEGFDGSLRLLAACDQAGMDAKEVGAALAIWNEACERGRTGEAPRWGDVEGLLDWIRALPEEPRWRERMQAGAAGLARELGLEDRSFAVKGSAGRPDTNLAAVLGQCVSSRGADPMRTFPFLAGEGPELEQVRALLAPLPLPERATDPRSPAGKGVLVFWHENLMAAIDASGFCAFSAGSLLADGVCTVEELAAWIAPEVLRGGGDPAGAGERLLLAGAGAVLVQRELNAHFGAPADQDRPPWADPAVDDPEALPLYRELRGIDAQGRPRREVWNRFERGEGAFDPGSLARTLDLRYASEASAGSLEGSRQGLRQDLRTASTLPARGRTAPGCLILHAHGPLGTALGGSLRLELELPAAAGEVLRAVAARHANAAPFLARGDRLLPSVWRGGVPVSPEELVHDGDELDLIVAISGG
jgi:aldehyde:ferredoxin oxidoreductase